MFITPIYNFTLSNNRYSKLGLQRKQALPSIGNQSDIFIKSQDISFTSNTSAGAPLKKLRDIICPYTGVKMLSGATVYKIEQKLDKCPTISGVVKVLSQYTDYMQKTEKCMYNRFSEYAKTFPNKTLPEYLQEVYDDSLTKLKLEEFFVLDDVDFLSRELSPNTAFELRKKITRCREVILENNQEDTFKRKTLLNSLDEIPIQADEKELFEKIKEKALYLPTSGSSENAFVVKYASRSHQEIAKRILRASVGTIEHIKPDSLGGENKLSNFMLASSSANSYRSNMPLVKFIEMHPEIPQNCQKYIDCVISAINKGKFRGSELYPYELKRTLTKESQGKIVLDLSKYKYTESKAYRKVIRKQNYLEQKRNKNQEINNQ